MILPIISAVKRFFLKISTETLQGNCLTGAVERSSSGPGKGEGKKFSFHGRLLIPHALLSAQHYN